MDQINTGAWVGRETLTTGSITAHQAALIHATLGEGALPRMGDVLPNLWHWCAFPVTEPTAGLARDGHLKQSPLLPPSHLPRRMWAGGALSFHKPLHVGEALECRSRVRAVTDKMGAAGPMVFVTVDHHISGEDGLAIEERQDIVYLDIPETYTPPAKREMTGRRVENLEPSEALLFRYSAVTFNSHRIHYDLRYTQEVEKYPALLVHGPLQATLLMRAAVREKGRSPLFFDFRGVHPMFVGAPCEIALSETDEGMQLCTGQEGHQCMRASAQWEETQ